MMSGLGSNILIGGVGAVILDDDSIQCPAHPNSNDAGTGGAFAVHGDFCDLHGACIAGFFFGALTKW